MLQVAIIGVGTFGARMLEELNDIGADIIIVDKDSEVIEKYKDLARDAYVTDAINQVALEKIIPTDIDVAIVDLCGALEVSIMATAFLKKMGISNIIAKAESDDCGEVLELVGATKIIYPDLDAAQRLTPILASDVLFNYMQVSENLALAEVSVMEEFDGKKLKDCNIRSKYQLNVVAFRSKPDAPFQFIPDADFELSVANIILVAGTEEAINKYTKKDEKELKKSNRFFLEKPRGKRTK